MGCVPVLHVSDVVSLFNTDADKDFSISVVKKEEQVVSETSTVFLLIDGFYIDFLIGLNI